MSHFRRQSLGFTLVEAIIVIVISGILAGIVASFIKAPVDAYFDTARRAALTDVADTAVRRMARDIGRALPNSIRQSISPAPANNQCIEFIPTKTGGRYRFETNAAGVGDPLDFSVADNSFNMLGLNSALPSTQQIIAGDLIAIYNLGIPGADAYTAADMVTSAVTGFPVSALANETRIDINSNQFPLVSGSHRFHVIPKDEKVVSFVCSGGTLYRNSNYAYTTSCPTAGGAVLATNVSCDFSYDAADQRNGLVNLLLTISSSNGETVSLYHEVHVNNTP